MKFYAHFLATVDDEVDDVDDECLLLYSQVALLADFKSFLSGLNFVALRLPSFTVNIEPKVLNPILARNFVLFLRTILNSLFSDALECGGTSTSLITLNKISNTAFHLKKYKYTSVTGSLNDFCNLLNLFAPPHTDSTPLELVGELLAFSLRK